VTVLISKENRNKNILSGFGIYRGRSPLGTDFRLLGVAPEPTEKYRHVSIAEFTRPIESSCLRFLVASGAASAHRRGALLGVDPGALDRPYASPLAFWRNRAVPAAGRHWDRLQSGLEKL
ncbi:hypothetical protein, partial [Rhizobium sp. Pop5]|uniref:hypothetical protein n=1 Tax=Rhizobium sp. Pop5 TaxID=1223565 RepID=UPI001969F7C3